MSANLSEDLNAFQAFVTANFTASTGISLEQALQEFREQQQWQPQTPLGQRLKELRSQFISAGGTLLSPAEIEAELRDRRGAALSE